jgi:hypothetical protein
VLVCDGIENVHSFFPLMDVFACHFNAYKAHCTSWQPLSSWSQLPTSELFKCYKRYASFLFIHILRD